MSSTSQATRKRSRPSLTSQDLPEECRGLISPRKRGADDPLVVAHMRFLEHAGRIKTDRRLIEIAGDRLDMLAGFRCRAWRALYRAACKRSMPRIPQAVLNCIHAAGYRLAPRRS